MRVLGADPGTTGAIAVLHDGVLVGVWPVPTVVSGTKNRIVPALLADLIRGELPLDAAFVEEVGSMPGQGVASTFAFGMATGLVHGVLAALRVPTTPLRPQEWRRLVGLGSGGPKGKAPSRGRAAALWPHQAHLFARVKDDGLAEAALIALAGHRKEKAR